MNITYIEYFIAKQRFRHLAMKLPQNGRQPVFDEFVLRYSPYNYAGTEILTNISEIDARRIKLLNGPHSETVFKAWIALMDKTK